MINKYFYLFIIIFFITTSNTFFNNNKRIISDFSLKENILFYGLLTLPTLNQYFGKNWREIQNTFIEEFKDFWNIKNLIKNSFQGEHKKDNILKLFNNIIIRVILVSLIMPRMFHNVERIHKFRANEFNQATTKNIFLTKNIRLKKQKEINNLIEKNNSEITNILNQLKKKNPHIEYRFNKTIHEPIDDLTSKKEIYKNAIKIKKALDTQESLLNLEELENHIKKLDVDDAFKDIQFITNNRSFFKNLPEIKFTQKENDLIANEPLEDTLQPVQSILLDKEHIERDSDLAIENSLNEYQYYLENKIKPHYPFPYSAYVKRNNKTNWWSDLFDTVNHVTKLE